MLEQLQTDTQFAENTRDKVLASRRRTFGQLTVARNKQDIEREDGDQEDKDRADEEDEGDINTEIYFQDEIVNENNPKTASSKSKSHFNDRLRDAKIEIVLEELERYLQQSSRLLRKASQILCSTDRMLPSTKHPSRKSDSRTLKRKHSMSGSEDMADNLKRCRFMDIAGNASPEWDVSPIDGQDNAAFGLDCSPIDDPKNAPAEINCAPVEPQLNLLPEWNGLPIDAQKSALPEWSVLPTDARDSTPLDWEYSPIDVPISAPAEWYFPPDEVLVSPLTGWGRPPIDFRGNPVLEVAFVLMNMRYGTPLDCPCGSTIVQDKTLLEEQ